MIAPTVPRFAFTTRILGLLVLALSLGLPSSNVVGQVCEPPLFVIQSSGGANVMILCDNSGSMNEPILHGDYAPDIAYSGRFTRDRVYYTSRTGSYTPSSFVYYWESSPTASLVNSDNGQYGRYTGNYLNWIFYHATELQRNSLPQFTRIQVTKEVLINLVDSTDPQIRLGLTLYDPASRGGNIIGKCGSNPVSLKAQIAGITANTWTPTGEAMETVLDYFADDGPQAVIESSCQMSFLIVMTDGFPTMDVGVSAYLHDADNDGNDPGDCVSIGAPAYYPSSNDCSDHMDDVAYYLCHTDLRSDLGEPGETAEEGQNVYTYAIGFALDMPLLQETAANGDGLYYTATNAADLALAFNLAMQDILMRLSSGSAVAVISTEQGDDDTLYRGKFMPGVWLGYVESFALPYENGDDPIWEAGALLADRVASDNRTIFTAIEDMAMSFVPERAGSMMEAMDIWDVQEAEDLINWARGEDVLGYRDRHGWPLGDIVHSSPVVVGPPSNFSVSPSYAEFQSYHSDRRKTIYISANDGMLHAFHADNGHEAWAFVPEFALPKIQVMADSNYCHTFSCDLTPRVNDVYMDGQWRTILVGGGRMGGCSYYALDITDADSPEFMWQMDIPDGMPYPSEPEFTTIDGIQVLIVGSGLDVSTGDAYIYALSLEDGSVIGSRFLSHVDRARNKATRPKAVDTDVNGEANVVYIGDMAGNMWRADVNDSANPSQWTLSQLFSCSEPITSPPTVARGEDDRWYVYFGTGAYLEEDDFLTNDLNRFYAVADRNNGASYSRYDLVNQDSGDVDLDDDDNGWYFDLDWHGVNERVVEPAVIVAGAVFFTSFAIVNDVCSAGGSSWLYRVSYDEGRLPESEEDDAPEERDLALEGGIASRPVVDLANETVIIQTTDSAISISSLNLPVFPLIVRSWQETWDTSAQTATANE